MLTNQNPQVLAAISDVVKGNREVAAKEEVKITENLSSRYNAFKPVSKQAKVESLQEEVNEELSPKQKKIAKLAGDPEKIDTHDLKKLRKESVLKSLGDIFEARGRPRKNPAPASDNDDGKEPDQHIHVQLKGAADMAHDEKADSSAKTKGGADVKFDNGTHFVHADHAKKVLSALDKLKPADREKMHAHIAQSHANFQAVHKLVS